MKIKKWICIILVIFLMPVIAVSANTGKDVYVNDEKIELPAVLADGEWMIPLRPVAEKLGYTVTWYQWEQNNRYVVLENQVRKTEIQLDGLYIIEYDAKYNKKAIYAPSQKPILLDGTIYVSSKCLQTALFVLIRTDDAIRIASVFDSATYHEYEFAIVERDGKYGYVGEDGIIAIPCVFDSVQPFENGNAVVQKDGKYGMIDETAEAVLPFMYDSIDISLWWDYAIVEKDGFYGVTDRMGKEILPIVYPTNGYNFRLYVDIVNKGYAIDEKGMPIMPFEYESITERKNFYTFCYEGKVGILDKNFELVTPAIYDTIRQSYNEWWYNDMIGVKQNGKFGMIDGVTGKLAIPCEYDFWMQFSGKAYAIAAKDGIYGAINEAGETVIPFEYEYISSSVIEGAHIATKNGKQGMIDAKGNVIVPCSYEKIYAHKKTISAVKNGKYGLLSPKGNILLPFEYDNIVGSDNVSLTKGSKKGIANENGDILIPVEYDEVKEVSSKKDCYYVKKDGLYGVLALDGAIVIPVEYEEIKEVSSKKDCYYVKKGGLYGVLALDGTVVIPVEYEEIGSFNWDLLNVKKDGKWGYVNPYHEVIIPFIYDSAPRFEDWGYARVVIGEEEFYIDRKGNRAE